MKLEDRLQELVARGEAARVALERLRQIEAVTDAKHAKPIEPDEGERSSTS